MDDQNAGEVVKIRARFDEAVLIVKDVDPKLPPPAAGMTLMAYTRRFSDLGWKASQASFDGCELIVELERSDSDKSQHYTYQAVQLSPNSLSQKGLLDEIQKPLAKFGWKQLACSNPLSDQFAGMLPPLGLWIVSVWMKELPRLKG